MELRGIHFGSVLGASGVQGFFGEGYWFHRIGRLLGWGLEDMTFVAKTATLNPREGNMPLDSRYMPRELFPSCIKVRPRRGVMLNSVGLSNPGLAVLLATGQWQARSEPFMLSIMSIAGTPEDRLAELREMIAMIGDAKDDFKAPFGLQVNMSCPNTGHAPSELIGESATVIECAAQLGIPIIPKYSIATAPITAIAELQGHPGCDAICVSNTLPFGWEQLDWKRVWGTETSPIAHLGGGGLSGKPLLPLVCAWIRELRAAGFTKPINGGGGILRPRDVNAYHKAGASSVFLGSVAALRPFRVPFIIARANSLDWRNNQ